MRISKPKPIHSQTERRIIEILENVVREGNNDDFRRHNIPSGFVALEKLDFDELSDLIREYIESRKFVHTSTFINSLFSAQYSFEQKLKLYSDLSISQNRRPPMQRQKFRDFILRLFESGEILVPPSQLNSTEQPKPMSFQHFHEMEMRLLRHLEFKNSTLHKISNILTNIRYDIQRLRNAKNSVAAPNVRKSIYTFLDSLSQQQKMQYPKISQKKICATLMFVTDLGALATTRDWSVAGTISGMSSALAIASME